MPRTRSTQEMIPICVKKNHQALTGLRLAVSRFRWFWATKDCRPSSCLIQILNRARQRPQRLKVLLRQRHEDALAAAPGPPIALDAAEEPPKAAPSLNAPGVSPARIVEVRVALNRPMGLVA